MPIVPSQLLEGYSTRWQTVMQIYSLLYSNSASDRVNKSLPAALNVVLLLGLPMVAEFIPCCQIFAFTMCCTSVIFYLVGVVHCLCHLFIKASVNLIQKICPKCIWNGVPSFIRRSWFCGISSRKKRPKPRLLLESDVPYSLSCSSPLGSLLLANVLFSHKHGADATSCCRNSSMPPSRELPPAKPGP